MRTNRFRRIRKTRFALFCLAVLATVVGGSWVGESHAEKLAPRAAARVTEPAAPQGTVAALFAAVP